MPGDKLEKYRRKRDAGVTPEPMGEASGAETSTRSGAFVVHLHDATRTHYDLRLEVGGVLASFAVPKGPPLDPEEKVLAVNTEDHPIEYLDFEDTIPEGNYGAGPMIAWDRGGVRYLETTIEEGLRTGKIDFVLSGFKLRGRFALVKLKKSTTGKDWLLIKKQDAFASKTDDPRKTQRRSVLSGLSIEELARSKDIAREAEDEARALGAKPGEVDAPRLSPMLCLAAEEGEIPTSDYVFELKLDGVRILADKRGGEVSLTYRSHRDATLAYPEIARAVLSMCPERVLLDGEIVAFDDEGNPSFQRLSQRIGMRGASVPVVYLVFDVLALGPLDLRDLPLSDRRTILRRILPGGGYVRALDYLEQNGRALFDFCRARKLEGIVAKRASSPYRASTKRTRDWLKIKCERDESFVVIGFTRGNEGRSRLGALDLGSYEGGVLRARGKVGSGLDDKTIDALLPKLRALETEEKLYEGDPGDAPQGRTKVRPEIVVSVRFLGWSDDGALRFPVFRGEDHDRTPKDCVAGPHADELALGAGDDLPPTSVSAPRKVSLTNQSKIFWPDDGYTKGDLCRYYEAIAPTMLPYLRDRPVVIVRYPDGIAGKNFYQWNVPFGFPKWMRHIALGDDDDETRKKRVFLVGDTAGLLTIANTGAIPIHILACREGHLTECDFCTLDFDVELATLEAGITLALELRALLGEIGLVGFPKTSGQQGLHVLIPLGPGVKFETAQALNVLLGRLVTAKHPEIATMEMSIKKRGARVFVDIGQTGRRRTIVAPYSVRAKPGATVSTPLTWEDVTIGLNPAEFTIKTVPDRVAKMGDPMRAMLEAKPDVATAVAKLGARLAKK